MAENPQKHRQTKYREEMLARGFAHVRVWIPADYSGWLHQAAEELRDAHEHNETPMVPKPRKGMQRHEKSH
jgi:hypothetical protein